MLVEHPVALARADKNLKKDIPWISVLAVGMCEGCLADIQRIGPMSEVDIFWTSTGLTCVMWVILKPDIKTSMTDNRTRTDFSLLSAFGADIKASLITWHKRLGHLGYLKAPPDWHFFMSLCLYAPYVRQNPRNVFGCIRKNFVEIA